MAGKRFARAVVLTLIGATQISCFALQLSRPSKAPHLFAVSHACRTSKGNGYNGKPTTRQNLSSRKPASKCTLNAFKSSEDGISSMISKPSQLQKWAPLVGQWAIYTFVIAGTVLAFQIAGDNNFLGLTPEGADTAAKVFPAVVVTSTIINYFINGIQGGGERIARIMGGQEATNQSIVNMVQRVYSVVGLSGAPPKVFIIPSNEPNAFAAGTGNEPIVAMTSGIVSLLTPVELEAVVGHEIGHLRNNDVGKALQLVAMLSGLATAMTIGDIFIRTGSNRRYYGYRRGQQEQADDPSVVRRAIGSALYLAGIVTYTTGTLLRLSSSRAAEFAADEFSARLAGTGRPLASALQKLEATHQRVPRDALGANWGTFAHMYIDNPPARESPLTTLFGLLRTHPTTQERVDRLMELFD